MMIAATTAVATPFMGPLPSRNSAPNGCPRASHPYGQTRGRGDGKTAYLGWFAPSLADCGADSGPSGGAISDPRARPACPAGSASVFRLIRASQSKTPARAGVGNVVLVLVLVTSVAPRTNRRCPCGPDPWPDRSAPGSC